MLEKVLQFYEVLQGKHGIIVAGEANSGKTTLIRLLETAFNKSSENELSVLIEERKRAKLKEIPWEEYEELVSLTSTHTV